MKKNKTAAHILDFQSFPSGIFSFSDIWNLILFSTLNPLVNITNLTFIESFEGKCFIAFVGESDFGIGIHRNKYVKLKKRNI